MATTPGQLGLEMAPELFLVGRRYGLRGSLEGRIDPEAAFFGMGNETRFDDEESDGQKTLELALEGRRRLLGKLPAWTWTRGNTSTWAQAS